MCYFNPYCYCVKRTNLDLCCARLAAQGVPYLIVECSFGTGARELPQAPNVLHVVAHDIMWQKERLLNLGIQQALANYQKIAWIDCDVLFEDDDWHIKTSHALESFAVVQPFSWSVRLPPGETLYHGSGEEAASFAHLFSRDKHSEQLSYREHGRTGFAWAGRREWLERNGLYDACIVGGGDHLMAHAFALQFDSVCLGESWGRGLLRDFAEWARAFRIVTRETGLGAIEGRLFHLWHGDLSKRQYQARRSLLATHAFDPTTDVRVGSSGAWEWASDKKELHLGVREYLSGRAEDDTSPAVEETAKEHVLGRTHAPDRMFYSREVSSHHGLRPGFHLTPSVADNVAPSLEANWVVYEWGGWQGFMLPRLIPGATRVTADPRDSAESVIAKIPLDGRVFAFHLDCTFTDRFPLCRQSLAARLKERGIIILNEYVVDISKRYVHDMCIQLGVPCARSSKEEGEASDLVIVKTNLNHHGMAERQIRDVDQEAMGIIASSPLDGADEYRLVQDPTLALEKYVANSAGIRYRCYFAGEHCVIATISSRNRIQRFRNSKRLGIAATTLSTLRTTSVSNFPPSLQSTLTLFVECSKADFGSIDVVPDDLGNAYTIDFNATPFTPRHDLGPETAAFLREGLRNRVFALGCCGTINGGPHSNSEAL
jgi:hypothetical protein